MPTKENSVSEYTSPKYSPKKDRSYRFLTLAVLAFFIGFILCFSFYSCTLISTFQLSKFFIGFTVVGFLIPLKYYQKWFHFIKYETIIFNIVGVGPFLTGLFLLLNFVFSSNPFTHQYKIEKIYFEGDGSYRSVNVILENNLFADEPKIINIDDLNPHDLEGNISLQFTIKKGLFGFDVIKGKKLK